MFDVLSKLAALDSANPNIANPLAAGHKQVMEADQVAQLPALEDMSTLRALSGLKPVAECGIMPMGGMENRTPASFSINASAADGDEVASMLSQIMNLAGVHKVGPEHMPNIDSGARPLIAEPPEKDIMRSAMDAMNDPEPEDEGAIGGAIGAGAGAMLGGPVGAALGGAVGGSMEDETAGEPTGGQAEPGTAEPMQSMADEIRGMADKLKDIEDKDELNLETYDNTPADPTAIPQPDTNAMAWNPNAGGTGGAGLANNPRAFAENLEEKLFAEYQAFVTEGKKSTKFDKSQYDGDREEPADSKSKPTPKGELNKALRQRLGEPEKKTDEAQERTMSRAAKGVMKYGKEGMKALAKAGKEGKDLDKVRDKYNKYD